MHEHLYKMYPDTYVANPWLSYKVMKTHKLLWCQPDGIIFDVIAGKVYIIEIKLQHCRKAYRQLLRTYIPVLQKIFKKDWEFIPVEICSWFNNTVEIPMKVRLQKNILNSRSHSYNVHIWRKK